MIGDGVQNIHTHKSECQQTSIDSLQKLPKSIRQQTHRFWGIQSSRAGWRERELERDREREELVNCMDEQLH